VPAIPNKDKENWLSFVISFVLYSHRHHYSLTHKQTQTLGQFCSSVLHRVDCVLLLVDKRVEICWSSQNVCQTLFSCKDFFSTSTL